jgi:hypothetical protein
MITISFTFVHILGSIFFIKPLSRKPSESKESVIRIKQASQQWSINATRKTAGVDATRLILGSINTCNGRLVGSSLQFPPPTRRDNNNSVCWSTVHTITLLLHAFPEKFACCRPAEAVALVFARAIPR